MANLLPEEETTKQSYNNLALIWSQDHMTPKFWGTEMEKFHELLPGGRILEIGSGGGRDAKELIVLGYEYIGTDVSSGLIKEAKKNNPGAIFKEVSVYDLNFNDRFDGFWCAAVLLHIPKGRINEALLSIRKNVKIGGIGFISVKDGEGERVEHDEDKEGGDRLFTYWSKEGFASTLRSNSYEILDYIYRPMSSRTRWHCFFVRVR